MAAPRFNFFQDVFLLFVAHTIPDLEEIIQTLVPRVKGKRLKVQTSGPFFSSPVTNH
jgi:hypothetical protein